MRVTRKAGGFVTHVIDRCRGCRALEEVELPTVVNGLVVLGGLCKRCQTWLELANAAPAPLTARCAGRAS